ncbi:MAG: antirestriction protein [Marinobacter sp.]|nr:antirestriction protein [Marinobacter sp.]
MENAIQNFKKVSAYQVADADRLKMLPKHFRQFCPDVEPFVYHIMGKLCDAYHGGYWEFFELSNGGFFMAPMEYGSVQLQNAENFADEIMSADASGIAVCLMAYNHLLWSTRDRVFQVHFERLREYALHHPQAAAIFRIID